MLLIYGHAVIVDADNRLIMNKNLDKRSIFG